MRVIFLVSALYLSSSCRTIDVGPEKHLLKVDIDARKPSICAIISSTVLNCIVSVILQSFTRAS